MVYGICAGPNQKAEQIAIPGIKRMDPDAKILVTRGHDSIFAGYNVLLDRARAMDGVTSMMLLHDDTELVEDGPNPQLERLLQDATIGVIGAVGGKDHPRMFWWQGVPFGHLTDDQRGRTWYSSGVRDVDTVDGFLMVLANDVFRDLRFDEKTYKKAFHGYDADICAQARASGARVVVADIETWHRNNIARPLGDVRMLYICDAKYRLKWTNPDLRTHAALRARVARLSSRRFASRLKARLDSPR